FLLFDHVWAPTAVMLGKADYPTLEQAIEKIQEAGHRSETSPNAGGRMRYLAPKDLPLYEGAPVAANVYVLGAALGHTSLGEILDQAEVANLVQARWKRGAERNRLAFQAGLEVSYGEY
ncbi:MAG: hypothetical protein U9R15_05630, partial [Chloroflexota bacterium]|nr:hypothetical protein [Chloroflexota bacterium]